VRFDLTSPEVRSAHRIGRPVTRRAKRSERRRLTQQDRHAAHLAELHCIRGVLADAIAVVSAGWLQHDWFAVTDEHGHRRRVAAHNVHVVAGADVSGACLVGAIVHAAGGPSETHTQLVQRTLDLTWHALYEGVRRPVRWCPAPAIRTAHVRDLTRWNDQHERTADAVVELLHSAVQTATVETERLRGR